MKYLAECWQQLLQSVVYTDWGLLDSGLHPQHLQQAAVGCHRQKVAITETKGTVNRLALHTHNLTAGERGEEWGGVCVCVCVYMEAILPLSQDPVADS